jgi:ferrous iron transport protein B
VATLGALYEQEGGRGPGAAHGPGGDGFYAPPRPGAHAFHGAPPPCMATAIAIKVQAGSVKWMLFSIAYPMLLGLAFATLVFSLGRAFGLCGLQAMFALYGLALLFTVFMGFFKNRPAYR